MSPDPLHRSDPLPFALYLLVLLKTPFLLLPKSSLSFFNCLDFPASPPRPVHLPSVLVSWDTRTHTPPLLGSLSPSYSHTYCPSLCHCWCTALTTFRTWKSTVPNNQTCRVVSTSGNTFLPGQNLYKLLGGEDRSEKTLDPSDIQRSWVSECLRQYSISLKDAPPESTKLL